MKKVEYKILKILAWVFSGVGFTVIILFSLKPPFNDQSGLPDSTLFSEYGSFIGGFVGAIFSLAGFFLLYLTLRAQQYAIKKQDFETRMESFESTFFNLLNTQQTITNDIKAYFTGLVGTSDVKTFTIQGRDFFRFAVIERNRIDKCLKSVTYDGFYKEQDNQQFEYFIEELYDPSNPDLDPFCNPSEEEEKAIQGRRRQLLNKVYGITEDKWKKAHKLKKGKRVEFIYWIFFTKFQYVVGHYFRNLYHIIKFVDQFESSQKTRTKDKSEQKEIEDKCYQYVQFIQAQMSVYELALLHDNALCFKNMSDFVKKYDLLENCSMDYLIDNKDYVS